MAGYCCPDCTPRDECPCGPGDDPNYQACIEEHGTGYLDVHGQYHAVKRRRPIPRN